MSKQIFRSLSLAVEDFGLNILSSSSSGSKYYIYTSDVIIVCVPLKKGSKKYTIGVSFFVNVRADIAALLVLTLNKLEFVDHVEVGEVFCYNDESKPVLGEDAVKLNIESIKKEAVNDFIKEQILLSPSTFEGQHFS